MRRSIASALWPPENPSAVNYAMWAFLGLVAIGMCVAVIAGTTSAETHPCVAGWVMSGGIFVAALGPLIAGIILIPAWRELRVRMRMGAFCFVGVGIYGAIVGIRLMLYMASKC